MLLALSPLWTIEQSLSLASCRRHSIQLAAMILQYRTK